MNDYSEITTQVLLCDLNSITNIGDLLLKTKDAFEIIEVKSGKKARGARITRQKERIDEIVTFFNTEKGFFQNRNLEIVKLPPRKHKLHILNKTFKECRSKGIATKQLSDFHIISCIDTNEIPKDSENKNEFKEIINELNKNVKSIWSKDRVVEISSLYHRQYSGINVPITVFPLDSATIVGILMGSKIYISFINIDALKAYILSKGWDVFDITAHELNPEQYEKSGFSIFHLFKNDNLEKNVTFPIDILLSCAVELIEIDCYLEFFNCIVEQYKEASHWIPFYENEDKIWK